MTRVKVETGQRRDGKVEIVNGIDKGDIIVTAGQLKLRDGVSVRVAGAETPVPAASTAPMNAPTSMIESASGLVTPANAQAPPRGPKS